jgi:hypothetical protein
MGTSAKGVQRKAQEIKYPSDIELSAGLEQGKQSPRASAVVMPSLFDI